MNISPQQFGKLNHLYSRLMELRMQVDELVTVAMDLVEALAEE
tara:strand:+ start:2740 stop:2868 length:129 start_codon:yes stop_codon:yes gene_type:complete